MIKTLGLWPVSARCRKPTIKKQCDRNFRGGFFLNLEFSEFLTLDFPPLRSMPWRSGLLHDLCVFVSTGKRRSLSACLRDLTKAVLSVRNSEESVFFKQGFSLQHTNVSCVSMQRGTEHFPFVKTLTLYHPHVPLMHKAEVSKSCI